jgi:hypothetical protein
MNGLKVEFHRHGTRREAFCVICGGLYQQECVAAALARGGVTLGEVCPRCLDTKPRLAARRLRKRAGRMEVRALDVRRRGGCPGLVDTVLDHARCLDYLAGQFPEAWNVTPDDLKRAETATQRELVPRLPEGVRSRQVGSRTCYQNRGGTPTPVSQGL